MTSLYQPAPRLTADKKKLLQRLLKPESHTAVQQPGQPEDSHNSQIAYWREHLRAMPSLLQLPTSQQRSAERAFDEASYTFHIPTELTSDLNALSQREGCTLSMTLLAAFQVWLARHCNQEDIVVTNHAPAQQIIRTDLAGNPGFLELLAHVRNAMLQAQQHQDAPFETPGEIVQSEQPVDETSLNQVHFALRRFTDTPVQASGLHEHAFKNHYDLFLELIAYETHEGTHLNGSLKYNKALFDEATIIRFVQRFRCLLEAIAQHAQERIWFLHLLPADEEHLLTRVWSAREQQEASTQENECLHQLFEAQARRTPHAVALVVEHEQFTYSQINGYADVLAQRLRKLGVGPEVMVGLCMSRSVRLLVGLLAILKAGGAYVPLDPTYPAERLRFQAQDAHLHLLLTSENLLSLWEGLSIPHLLLDNLPEQDPQIEAADVSQSSATPDQLAYLIYTSGSTGKPKGVCIAHRNTVALIRWAMQHYSTQDLQGVLAGTSVCFDLSLFELFAPWSCGGTVYLVPSSLDLPAGSLAQQITLINTVPSVMTELLRTHSLPSSVRVINLAGEPLPRSLVNQLYALPGIERVYNLYGPTEDTTYSTWELLSTAEPQARVPLGRPLDGSQLYLLDAYGHPVPIGVVGEIYLGGDGVTRGYLHRPELTAERYLADPFTGQPGRRLYRTGDLACYRTDGSLEHVGRADHQVKIRGYRVELGEIEHLLCQQAEIQECVVVAWPDQSGARLVAYVVVSGSAEGLQKRMHTALKEHLPAYMLPGSFVALAQLPKTSTGKVNRKALPEPQAAREQSQPNPQAATQSRAEQALNLSAGKKALLKKLLKQEHTASTIPLTAISREGKEAFPLSFAQQQLWLLDQLDPESATYNIPSASRLLGKLNRKALIRSLQQIVERHEALRTAFTEVDGVPMQSITPASTFRVSRIDLRPVPQEEQRPILDEMLAEEASEPFDLRQGMLIRARLIQLQDEEHILCITMHHIASDGWSIQILHRELLALYEAFDQQQPSPLAPLSMQYIDYAIWQRRWLQGNVLHRQLNYWQQQLSNLPTFLPLPTDRPRPVTQTFQGASYTFLLGPELTSALKALSQSEGCTLFMTLLAAFQVWLARHCNQEDIVVGTPVANRQHVEIEALIGFFVNTLVIRTDLSGNPDFREVLHRVREMSMQAYSHQDLPFEQVVEAVGAERSLSHSPLFQVLFSLQTVSSTTAWTRGLQVEPLQAENTIAKFDLSLDMQEQVTDAGHVLKAELEYNRDLFDTATIVRFAQRLRALLETIVALPQARIWDLDIVPAQEHEQLQNPQHISPREIARKRIMLASTTRPLSKSDHLYLLDRYQHLVPVGVLGEIYLDDDNDCLYPAGELAYYRADGTLERLGRIENYVRASTGTQTKKEDGGQASPQSALEQQIAEIWASVLGIKPPGRTENFFEIGGHSLSGVRVIARVRDQLGADLSLRQLFAAPTVQELAAIIEKTPDKERRSDSLPQQGTEPTLVPVKRDQPQPLSFAQQQLWVVEQLNPSTPTYNIPLAVRLSGPLHKRALAQSLRALVARHETLRTTFHMGSDGVPTQHIISLTTHKYPINFSLIDARRWSSVEREQLSFLFVNEEATQSFDLTTGPLMRGHLVWVDDNEYILLLTFHHIISDGWSIEIISQELSALYRAFSTGEPSPLPELPIQYVDYTAWQRQKLQGETYERMLDYWKQQLAGVPTVLALPTDRPRPPRQTFNGNTYHFTLPQALTEPLQQIGQSEGATLFMTLLAAFQLLLCRYSGQEDIVVGTPIANRTHVAVESLIGFFINTLVLRTDLRGNPSFRTLLQRVRNVALDAYQHQHIPFEQVVNAVQPERDMAYAPLCQIVFHLENISSEVLELADITLKTIEIDSTSAKFDLTLTMSEHEEGIHGEFEYNSDLFERTTIERMATHLQHLLAGIAAQPDQPIWHLPILGDAEFQQIVFDWNQTSIPYSQERFVHQLIETQAELNPHALALVAGAESITYRELNQRANQLAHYLLAHNLQPGNIVGIYQERTIGMVVSLVAVLKTCTAYMPIDPDYPTDRLMFLLKDSDAPILLTQQSLASRLPALAGIVSISIDSEQNSIVREATHNPNVVVKGDDLAYVIYTSGSTGTSKGVAIQHQSLLSMLSWYQQAFSLQQTDRGTHLVGLGFDATIGELWPYLAAGAQVHLASDEVRISPQIWQRWVNQQGITVCFLPTPLAERALTLDWSEPTSLRALLTGGDQLHHHPDSQIPFALINNYGPTENTMIATSALIPVQQQPERLPTIGRPIGNTQIYVLDQELQPQPVGVPGELYIGGAGLAQGYLHRPELTAERFVPHPFSTQPGARLYRTGDLVKYLPDGTLEFLGRQDFLVKIRGYRIDLGEIIALLTEHSAISENIVVVHEDSSGDKRLVAYIVPRQSSQLTCEQIQDYLRERLPAYMVPAAIVLLDELPTNANGQVDRQALPPPQTASAQTRSYVAPRDTIELKLTHIWETLLQNGPVSVTDDFFEIGGHSLLAVRLMTRIQHEFQQELPLSVLFQEATPAKMAEIIRQTSTPQKRSALVVIQKGSSKPPFFCVHPVGGQVLCYADLAHQLGPEQPFYGLQMPELDVEDQLSSIEEMACTYIAEIQRIQPEGPYLLGGWSLGGVIAFEMARQLERRGQGVALLALFDSYSPSVIHQQSEAPLIQQFVEDLEGLFSQTLHIDYAELQSLTHQEQLARLYAYLKQANVVPPDIEIAYLTRLFSTYRRNIDALYRYQPQSYAGRLTLFCATSSTESAAIEQTYGWRSFLQQEPVVHTIASNHYTLLKNPHLDHLVSHLKHSLDGTEIGGNVR
jgi:amino acid adenylation domain-containing protein